MAVPDVSVIVTTRNEERNIGNCLEYLKIQTYQRELIKINNYSIKDNEK